MNRALRLALVAAVFLVALLIVPGLPGFAPVFAVASVEKEAAVTDKAGWTEVERLIKELKLREASARLDAMLPGIVKGGNDDELMRALVRGAQLRAGSGQPEEAVRFLQAQEQAKAWPEGKRERAVLSLFQAEALQNYYNNYRWTIWQREAVLSKEPVDVEKWTAGQIFEAASKAYLEAWQQREALGAVPVTGLSDFLVPNTYPKKVRGTLRDTLTYLWVGLLADTGYWSPRQTNATAHFDLAALFRDERGERDEKADAAKLGDPEIHPLLRALTVLAEHERWHASQGNLDGALEARLERFRRLQNHASTAGQTAERTALADELEAALPAFCKASWWSMGMAELARVRQYGDELVEAVRIARAGAEAWPKSPGALECLSIVQQIEAPELRVSVAATDAVGRRSVQVTHKNLPAVWFRAYPLDLEARIKATGPIFPGRLEEIAKGAKPVLAWKADLPATPDFREHVTYVTPPADRPGIYILVASTRQDFAETDNRILSTPIVLGNLALLARQVGPGVGKGTDGFEVTLLSGERGEPVAGATVNLYRSRSWETRERAETRTTDQDGRVRFDGETDESTFVTARKGGDLAFLNTYSPRIAEEGEAIRSLVFTDRSIYRPQQSILWKVLVYEDKKEGRLRGLSTSVTVSLIDPNGQSVESRNVTTNDFGTASGEFAIPAGRPLGGWRIQTSREGDIGIRVEEYKRPTFEIALVDPAEPLRLGKPASFTGRARYYFGLPVTHGEVSWRAVRQPLYSWYWSASPADEEVVASGTARLTADGTFPVNFTPDPGGARPDPGGPRSINKDAGQLTYRYKITAELTDEGGETRTAERSFRLGWVSIEAELQPSRDLLTAGKPSDVTIVRKDLDGIGRAGEGTWTLVSLRQPETTPLPSDLPFPVQPGTGAGAAGKGINPGFATPGDRLRPRGESGYDPRETLRLWEDGARVTSGTLRHATNGEAKLSLPGLEPGAYRLRYETADPAGEPFSTSIDLVVGGPKPHLALPGALFVDASDARPGGKVTVLAHSGFPDQLLWLETWRGGRRLKSERLRMGKDSSLVEIPIRPEDRGGFTLKLVTLRDFQLVDLTEHVVVPWDDRRLEIEATTFRDRIRPGGRETWTLKIRPAEGQGSETPGTSEALAAELLASMYDRSLDLFAPHHPADPLNLYPDRRGAPGMQSSLGRLEANWVGGYGLEGNIQGPGLQPDQLRFRFAFNDGDASPMRRGMANQAFSVDGVVVTEAAAAPAPPPPPGPGVDALQSSSGYLADRINIGTKRETDQPPAAPEALRSEFSETAFWEPHLLTGPDGTASLEFTVPDSVTAWTFWVRALTRDLRAGSLTKEVRTVKDLMVRPYVPRFLREGDKAELQVVVNNASDKELTGEVVLELLEPGTDRSRLNDFGLDAGRARARFTAAPGGGTTVRFPLTTPAALTDAADGSVAFKVTATAGSVGDGELRLLPILPSRMHLAQSRSVALQGNTTREMAFADRAKPDATRVDEQLVVTLDAQLFQGVLAALPYLVTYPYDCTEQTLNRFLSTGIVTSLFDRYPAVAAMAKDLSARETRYETWDAADPNRKMALEETPWLALSQGGADVESPAELINVLDRRIAKAQRDEALMKLRQAQLSDGAFPWWPGGPPSPYMTLYLLYGFAKASEFGVEVPRDVVANGWQYLAGYYRTEEKPGLAKKTCCRELLVLLNYVASTYPDESWMGDGGLTAAERKEILDDSFAHWRQLPGSLKALLAMTLKRAGRPADAVLVLGSVLDLAKTTPDEGIFWAPEEHAWLWYNDNIETHAFILRALTEIAPQDARRHGLVQWLFLNKQLNHWKSTRATAEVIYALVHYLEKEGTLAAREEAVVKVEGQTTTFVFEPDRYTGKHNQLVVPGDKMKPGTDAKVVVENRGPNLMFATTTWHFSTEELPKEARGDLFGVTRRYFLRTGSGTGDAFVLKPLDEGTVLKPGDEVEVQLTITSRAAAEFVHLRDPRPAGLEPQTARSGYRWDFLAPGRYEETRDSGANFFFDWVPAGEYTLSYRLRANMAGTFRTGPATLQSMYAPELTAYSAGDVVTVGSDQR